MKRSRRVKSLPKVSAVFQIQSGGSNSTEDWVVLEFHLKEAIAKPYQGYVDVVTYRSDVDYSKLVGKHCALVLSRGPKRERTFAGIIFRVEILGDSGGQTIARFNMAAAVFALQYGRCSRYFENMSSAEIVKEVLTQGLKPFQREVGSKLVKKYPRRECCAQFQESDLDFVNRLLAEEGIFYYFDQSGKYEKLVLVDSNDACPQLTPKKAPAPPKVVEPLPPPKLDVVKLRVVDNESSEPVPGVKVKIKLLSGIEATMTTNKEGIAEKQVEPATYRIFSTYAAKHSDQYLEFIGEGESPISTDDSEESSEKSKSSSSKSKPNIAQWPSELIICQVEEHKVKTGETLYSLACKCGMAPSELAYYNWGTWEKDEIEMFMRTKVGCTKKNQQGKYCFDDSDDPGIIYCPKDWELNDVPRNKLHTLRVRKVDRGLGDLMLFIKPGTLSQEGKNRNVILEATDQSWQQSVKVADMPEIEPGTIQLSFSDVPSGKTFNIIQENNGMRQSYARDLSYGEIRELAFYQYDTMLNDEEERQTWEESQDSESEELEEAGDESAEQSANAEESTQNESEESSAQKSENTPPQEEEEKQDQRIPIKIESISNDGSDQKVKELCQSLDQAILQGIENSKLVRTPKTEGGRWMMTGTSFILSGIIRLSVNLIDVETSDKRPVINKKAASIDPQATAMEIVRNIESIV